MSRTTQPHKFMIYYDGEPFRRHVNINLDKRKNHNYVSMNHAKAAIGSLLKRAKYYKEHKIPYPPFWDTVDPSKFEIVEFTIAKRWHYE